MAHPGGRGPVATAGTRGVTTAGAALLLAGCLVAAPAAAAAAPEAGAEFLSEPVDGLESEAEEGPEAGVRTGVSEPDWPSLPSAGAEPLLDDAEEKKRRFNRSLDSRFF